MSESLDLAAEIGLRVRNNRTLLKLSREKLAEEADISLSFLADIEHGRKNMTTVTLYGLCKALHVSADYRRQYFQGDFGGETRRPEISGEPAGCHGGNPHREKTVKFFPLP